MRRPFAVAVALALAVLTASAALDRREVAFETGLPAFDLVADLAPGADLCIRGVDVPASFQRVRIVVGGSEPRAQPLNVALIDETSGRRVGGGEFAGGEPDPGGNVEMAIGDVPAGGRLRVCVTNEGQVGQRLFGSPPNRSAELPPLLAVVFVRDPAPTMLSLVPEAFRRSALFKPGWFGPWTSWLLLAVVVLAVPFALSRSLTAAYASERSSSASVKDASEAERSS